jgi:hypothetical protein
MAKTRGSTPRERQFFRAYVSGMTATDAYLLVKPDVTRDTAAKMGYRLLKRLKGKPWGQKLDDADQDEVRILEVLEDQLNCADPAIRQRALELLVDLHGKRKAEVNVHTDVIQIVPAPKPVEDHPADD